MIERIFLLTNTTNQEMQKKKKKVFKACVTDRERDLQCLIFSSLCIWMDLCGSLVLFPPGSPVELDICKLASPAAAFKVYQFVGEWEQAGCKPYWVSSSGWGVRDIGLAGYYILQIEHRASGSNPRVMLASWLMWTFSSLFPCRRGHVGLYLCRQISVLNYNSFCLGKSVSSFSVPAQLIHIY